MTLTRILILVFISSGFWQTNDKVLDCHECIAKYNLVENDSSQLYNRVFKLCEMGFREGADCPRMLLIQNYMDTYVIDRKWYFVTPLPDPAKSLLFINSGFDDEYSDIKEANIGFDSLLTILNSYEKRALNSYEDGFVYDSVDTSYSYTIYPDDNLWGLLEE